MRIDTIRDLIDELEQYDEGLKVRVAYQPSWPLRARVSSVTSNEEMSHAYDDEDDESSSENFLWIALTESVPSDESPYAPRDAWTE